MPLPAPFYQIDISMAAPLSPGILSRRRSFKFYWQLLSLREFSPPGIISGKKRCAPAPALAD